MKCVSLYRLIGWEIIALNVSEKEDLQLIQCANPVTPYKPLIGSFYLEYTNLIFVFTLPALRKTPWPKEMSGLVRLTT
jgi:hypothetical protein